eukprot:4991626-Ditylum_brightwellii.AAC.1
MTTDTKKHFQWKKQDFDAIDWIASIRVFNIGNFYHKCFITRYMYECLPVKGEDHSAQADRTCLCCMKELETIHHFLHCQIKKETWSLLPDLFKPIFNDNEVDL